MLISVKILNSIFLIRFRRSACPTVVGAFSITRHFSIQLAFLLDGYTLLRMNIDVHLGFYVKREGRTRSRRT
jgi:hypothetical protein